MAKISKKPPASMSSFEVDTIAGLFSKAEASSGGEPIIHTPHVDMYSTSGKLVIEVELAGVKKNDIEVTLDGQLLTVRGVKYECFDEEKINYVCMERAFGKFQRDIDIPFPVDSARIKAVYKNGILTVTVPRVEDKRCSSRKVPIETDEL